MLLVLAALLAAGCRPSRESLAREAHEAAQAAWAVMVKRIVPPAIAALEGEGWVEVSDPNTGEREVFGPGMYVEGQAYDVAWFLYGDSLLFDRPQDQPLVDRAVEALLRRQHPDAGGWPWSDDGCIHEVTAVELWRRGRRESARRAVEWAARWMGQGRITDSGALLETEGVYIVKSWGRSGEAPRAYDGSPPPVTIREGQPIAADELPFLIRMFLETGTAERYPELMRRLNAGQDALLAELGGVDARVGVDFLRLMGVTCFAELAIDGLLPRDERFERARQWIRLLATHAATKLTDDALIDALLLDALVRADLFREMPEVADALAYQLMAQQTVSGAYGLVAWYFDTASAPADVHDPLVLRTVGGVHSAVTTFAAMGLERYARAVLGEAVHPAWRR